MSWDAAKFRILNPFLHYSQTSYLCLAKFTPKGGVWQVRRQGLLCGLHVHLRLSLQVHCLELERWRGNNCLCPFVWHKDPRRITLSGQRKQKDSGHAAWTTAYFLTSVSVQRIATAAAAFQLDFDNEQLCNYKILFYCTSCVVIIRLFV